MASQVTGPSSAEPGARAGEGAPGASIRDRLLQKISVQADLPALGGSVSRVVQMTSSDDEAVRNLAHFILSDVALTQKILRIANTVYYRSAAGRPVTTVSKAIFLLGLDTVKTCALGMLLVDGMPVRHAKCVRNELGYALCASIIGREMARRGQYKDSEEAAIASLFKNVGCLLVAAHDHQLYDDIARLVEEGRHTPAQASMQVLGCSFDVLAEGVLREWNIPEAIIHALASPTSGSLKLARNKQEWLQQVAAFSATAARLILDVNDRNREVEIRAVLARYGVALNLNEEKLNQLFEVVAQQTRDLAINTDLGLYAEEVPLVSVSEPEPVEDGSDLPMDLLLDLPDEDKSLQIVERHASGKPVNARDLLLAGVLDATQMLASGRCKVNDLLLLVLETLFSGMGFRFATVCLKDIQTDQFRARIAMGEKSASWQSRFVFPTTPARDLFHLSMENNADLIISDANAPKIAELLPAWHRALLPDARSFILLPLVVNNKQLGLFYADRAYVAPEGVPADEAALIKTLKGQVLTALQAR